LGLSNDHRGYVCAVWHSDDDGHTWTRSENVVSLLEVGVEAQEPHVVELRDGRLMMLFRTYSGSVGVSYSDDRGRSWSPGHLVEALPLPAHSSALHVSRMPATGDLLLVRATGDGGTEPGERPQIHHRLDGQEHGIRTPLTAAVSCDEGQTWDKERVIAGDPYGDYGYPSVLHLEDLVLVSYHALDGLHVARIPIDWFYEKV
jgi:sialidase-1